MIFDARQIARGWLAVALASGTDKERPALNRTVHIEQHAHGVRLVATDSYVLLHSFVPDIESELDQAPELDEAPISTGTAIDPHGRGKGFLAHALKLATAGDDPPVIEVRVHLNVPATATPQGAFAGMEALSVVVEQPDVERLILESFEGPFPAWRSVIGSVDAVATDRIALNPEIVGRLAKVGKIHPSSRLGWTFGGEDKAARVEVIDSDPFVDGLVMPCRWDFDRNEPRVDDKPADDEEGDDS